MKKLYLLLLACLLTGVVFAQEKSSVKFGVKAGLNLATMSSDEKGFDEAKKSLTSFHIGGTVDILAGASFIIQPGLTLTGKGIKYYDSYDDEDGSFEGTVSQNIMYLEIPVNAIYKISNFYLGAGPYAAFALSGKSKVEGRYRIGDVMAPVDVDGDLKFGSGDEDNYKLTDFGLNVLAGYQLPSGINFGVNYGLGLSNIINSDDKVKNRVFSLSVGFKF